MDISVNSILTRQIVNSSRTYPKLEINEFSKKKLDATSLFLEVIRQPFLKQIVL